jgi:2-oxoglutarate dehydrogenase E1 component
MYREIERRKSVRESYLDRLLAMGDVTRAKADRIAERRREHLEEGLSLARQSTSELTVDMLSGHWKGYLGGKAPVDEPDTGVDRETLSRLLLKLCETPPGMRLHKRLPRLLEQRRAMARGEEPLDWATAESLALATLVANGLRVRLSGQDSIRGTFSQRHSAFYDAEDGRPYFPLQNLGPGQGPVEIINSPLSETGVLGFEYGYSLDCPDGLIAWEAQFGDFCNAAQVIIDQFITSAEEKWRRLSSLVLLLPHGFEGQGPEHSSARMERFLALAAEDNIQVVYPSTPAQYFHVLRRQAIRKWKKPLVVFTPKSLLRRPQVVSPLADLASGIFQRVLPEARQSGFDSVRRVLLCTGKVYYDLLEEREKRGIRDIDILRIEELYPFPERQLGPMLARYPKNIPLVWVQEEPENMGAWRYLRVRGADSVLGDCSLSVISRPESASPATGSKSSHELEQQDLLDRALAE